MKEIKQLDDSYFDASTELSEYAFQYELSKEELEKKRKEKEDHVVLGWVTDEDKLAGKVHIIPFKTYVNGQIFEMGGIASVATWPEYRRQGISKHLMYQSLVEMKNKGQVLSFLSPFSHSFYRKLGWELAFTNQSFSISTRQLRQDWKVEGYVKREQPDLDKLEKVYTAYAKSYTGTRVREDKWWKSKILTPSERVVFSYNHDGEPEGYLIYQVKNNGFTIKDFAYSTINGWKLLLEFIGNHDSMANNVWVIVPENEPLPLLLENPKFDQRTNHSFMARIVDVLSFFKQYPFEQPNNALKSLTISVDDGFFDENSGVYHFTNRDSGIEIEKTDHKDSDIQCSIQMLTMMLLGYKRPLELYRIGHITGDEKAIEQLDALIPIQQTFLPPVDGF